MVCIQNASGKAWYLPLCNFRVPIESNLSHLEEEVLNVLGMLLFELELFFFLFGNNNKLFSSLDKGNMESAIHFPSRIQKSRAKEEYQFARHLVRENSLCIHRI